MSYTPLKRSVSISLFAGFSPSATGADAYEATVPFDSANGTGSVTYNIRRLTFRVSTAGGAPSMKVQKSTVGDATFGAGTDVGTVTLGSGGFEANNTSSLGTIASGSKLRVNVLTLATALGWSIDVLLGE